MKIISYRLNSATSYGVLVNNELYSLPENQSGLPASMNEFLALEEKGMLLAQQTANQIASQRIIATPVKNYEI